MSVLAWTIQGRIALAWRYDYVVPDSVIAKCMV